MTSGNNLSETYTCIHGEIPVNKTPSDEQIYINMVKNTESYLPIDVMFKVFVLLDWDPISKALKVSCCFFCLTEIRKQFL